MALSTLTLCLSLFLLVSCHVLEGKVISFAASGKREVQEDEPQEPSDTVTLGCYVDKPKDRVFSHMYKNYRNDSNLWSYHPSYTQILEGCADAAKRRGYQYFGIEYYGECWSGKIDGEWQYDKHRKSEKCIGRVGKGNTIMVYKFKGCFEFGQYYADGEEMPLPPERKCASTCRCSGGEKTCYERSCPVRVNADYCETLGRDTDDCCDICECIHNNETMADGAQWTVMKLDDGTCTSCTCIEGRADCSEIRLGCTPPTTRPTIPPETEAPEEPIFSFP